MMLSLINYMNEQKKTILILVGRGKSTLTNWIKDLLGEEVNGLEICLGAKYVIKHQDDIKKEVSSGFKYIIHMESESEIKKLPLGIKRRSLVFKIDF